MATALGVNAPQRAGNIQRVMDRPGNRNAVSGEQLIQRLEMLCHGNVPLRVLIKTSRSVANRQVIQRE
jgi:hypothetical protein